MRAQQVCLGAEGARKHWRRAQRSLIVHFQPRQFPRVPLATEVRVHFGDEVLIARSQEIGAGGMALENASRLSVAQPVQLSFTLSSGRQLNLHAVVWWKRDHRVGIRFDPRDGNCRHIAEWVEQQIKSLQTNKV